MTALRQIGRINSCNWVNQIATARWHTTCVADMTGRAGQTEDSNVSRRIVWLENGLTLKMNGKLVGEWAEQARDLLTADKGLIVDLTDVTYVDSAGERLLSWLGSVGALFAARGVYTNRRMRRSGFIADAEYTCTATWESGREVLNSSPCTLKPMC